MQIAKPDDGIYRSDPAGRNTRVVPSAYAGGPWNPKHQHGGAVAGILTRALDRMDAPAPMRIARLTIEMFRGVPLAPLAVETELVRGGRRIQSAEARLLDGETCVARATALRIRRDESLADLDAPGPFDPDLGQAPTAPPTPRDDFAIPVRPGYSSAAEIHSAMPEACGVPAVLWTRLRCRFFEGEDTPPIVQLAALADFASGTGNAMDYSVYSSINPDLTIHVLREPRSEWLAIRGTTLRAGDGIGQSAAVVYDQEGEVARVSASLLLDRHPNSGA